MRSRRNNPTPRTSSRTVLSVSRSGGFGSEGDSLKSFRVQEQFWTELNPQLSPLLPQPHHRPSKNQEQQRQNFLIQLRKLREGVSASHRTDAFARSIITLSLHLAVIFDSPRDAEPCISLILAAQSTEDDVLFIALLYIIVHSGLPRFFSTLKSTQSLNPSNNHDLDRRLTWLRHLASSLNTSNYTRLAYTLRNQVQPSSSDSLTTHFQSLSLAHTTNSSIPQLSKLSTDHLLHLISLRSLAWPVLQSAYREFHLHSQSETRSWLSTSLSLTAPSNGTGATGHHRTRGQGQGGGERKDKLDDWLSEKEQAGQLVRKSEGQQIWIALKPRRVPPQ